MWGADIMDGLIIYLHRPAEDQSIVGILEKKKKTSIEKPEKLCQNCSFFNLIFALHLLLLFTYFISLHLNFENKVIKALHWKKTKVNVESQEKQNIVWKVWSVQQIGPKSFIAQELISIATNSKHAF